MFCVFPPGGGFNATLITAVAAQANGGQMVEVKVTTSIDGVRRLSVYVDGVVANFPSPDVKWLDFRGQTDLTDSFLNVFLFHLG